MDGVLDCFAAVQRQRLTEHEQRFLVDGDRYPALIQFDHDARVFAPRFVAAADNRAMETVIEHVEGNCVGRRLDLFPDAISRRCEAVGQAERSDWLVSDHDDEYWIDDGCQPLR